MSSDIQFKGYAITDKNKWSDLKVTDITPKKWEEEDIDIAITHCGVCGSDIHTLTNGWGNLEHLPLVVGHEIVGKAVRVGSVAAEKTGFKVGDRVGVGARIGSCGECRACKTDNENYCPKGLDTYNSPYPDGTISQGGFSTAIRANHRFVFPVPEKIKSEHAASMMCAGLTVFSPLVRNGCGPGKKVGIVGLGGLGHYAVMFAKALGAEVYVLSHSDHKESDAKKLGADHFVVTTKQENMEKLQYSLDLIISTVDVTEGYPLKDFLSLLFVNGTFINVGIPDSPLPQIGPFDIVANGARLGGSLIGSKKEATQMLQIAAEKDLEPMIELFPMSKVKEAVEGMKAGKPRYRYVTASHGPYPHPFALSALAPETIAECAGLSVVLFKMVALLVLATIIGSLVPAVPVPSSLAPVHNATIAYSPRMPFGDLGRTFTSCVGGLFPAGGVSLAVPDFWSSKPPVRRTVCTSHGLRLAATPAQCLALVSAQLGMPSPTDLTLSPPVALLTLPARRPFLTLPAAPRPVILALPAPIHVPILMLPAPKHAPILMLPAPKRVLTLSGPPDLIPAPAVLLPAIDNLYVLPFPTSVAHAAQPSWKVPADLSWSVSGARVFATKYVVDPRKTVTVLVMACLIVLTLCWTLACIREDALDLVKRFSWLVRCVWVGPPQECLSARLGFGTDGLSVYAGWANMDALDGLDADVFVPTCSVASRGPIPSMTLSGRDDELVTTHDEDLAPPTEVAAVVAGQEPSMSHDTDLSTSNGVADETEALEDISGPVDASEDTTVSNVGAAPALEEAPVEVEPVEETSCTESCVASLDMSVESPTPTMAVPQPDTTIDQPETALPLDNDTQPEPTSEHVGESSDDRSDLDTEADGSSYAARSMGSAATISSFDMGSTTEDVALDAKEGLEAEEVVPVSELATEAAAPAPASDLPLASESVSNEARDECAQGDAPETGLLASRWAPGTGPDDEEVAAGGIRRRGKRAGRRVQKRRENALRRGEEGSSGGVEGAGEVGGAGDGANGEGAEVTERGFSSGTWFSHRRRRERRD
ncbi:alcohol dehydrogenase [Ceratobasidium sp. AG-Ba]|nr:alcohol dehydrogenase [Ceratobasidium sp. AG-Ba]